MHNNEINVLIDPEDGKIDLNKITGIKRLLVVPVLLSLAVIALASTHILQVSR